MKFHFKKDQYGWGDSFYIYNDQNEKVLNVKTSTFLLSKKVEIKDMNKNLFITIKNEPKSLLKKKFYIIVEGKQVASITKELSLIPKYIIEGLDWEREGVMLHEYDMYSGGKKVFGIHEESSSWGIRPILDIAEGVDPRTALGVCMTISYVMNFKEGEGSTTHL